MSHESRVSLRWPVFGILVLVLVGIGAGVSYLLMRSGGRDATPVTRPREAAASETPGGAPAPAATAASVNGPLPDIVVTLSEEAVKRTRLGVAPVESASEAGTLRLPGVVAPNAYRQVSVTPLVSGRVTRVLVELGQQVRQGQTLAQIFSPELAEAQTRYIAARATLEAHDKELARTQKLVDIGAASRQELERIHAEHAAQKTEVDSLRSRLQLLGVGAASLDGLAAGKEGEALTNVPAPIAGVVTERLANPGLNVDPAAKLFTVTDLSTVWIVADLYEKDFSHVRVDDAATITSAAYPALALKGVVNYIDPQVSTETRTAKTRVEVPNPRGDLRLGMYADVILQTSAPAARTLLTRTAVQTVGDRSVVYLTDAKTPGRFIEREVRLGEAVGERDRVEVLNGVAAGDLVVTEGSFFLRAERERLGLRQQTAAAVPPPAVPADGAAPAQTAKVTVGEQGFQPAQVTVKRGGLVRLTFVRTTDNTCAKEIVVPSLKIRRPLPLNEPVVVEFTPRDAATLEFACGMAMLRGTIVVQ